MEYLPIGSVVMLKGADRKLMIYGRLQQDGGGKLWDYIGCLYPEGNISSEHTYLFNHGKIAKVFFMGHEDGAEKRLKQALTTLREKILDQGSPGL